MRDGIPPLQPHATGNKVAVAIPKRKEIKKMNGKSRYWAFIMYEDSMPKNYKEILNEMYLPICVSPRHDKDIYEEDTEEHKKGDLKKPHYHVLLAFGNTTTYKNALSYAKQLGAKIVKQISSSRGAYEYWTHKNNPEKAQYKEEDMQYYGGFNVQDNIGYSDSEQEQLKRAVIDIINNKGYTEYKTIYDYCNENKLYELCAIISHNTIFYNAYIKSKKYILTEKITHGNIKSE